MGEHAQRYRWGLCRRPWLARPSWLSVRHPPHQERLGMRAWSRRSSPVLTSHASASALHVPAKQARMCSLWWATTLPGAPVL
jgi:hypothetical protein